MNAKRMIWVVTFLLTAGAAQAQLEVDWERTFGGGSGDQCNSLIGTARRGIAMAGTTRSLGAGDGDFWLIQIGNDGDSLWSSTFGGRGDDGCHSLIETVNGEFALAGETYSFGAGNTDIWLVRTDRNGDSLWSRTFGGGDFDVCNSLIQTADRGFAMAGYTESFGAGNSDFWLVRTDGDGDSLWSRTFGGENNEQCESLIQTADGGFAMAGTTWSFGAGSYDFWLVRTDRDGDSLWSRTFGGREGDHCSVIIQTADGGFAMAGYTDSFGAGADDFWLVRTDGDGDSLWSRTFGGGDDEYCYSLIQTAHRGFAMAGYTNSFGAGADDFWLVRTDGDGDSLWSHTFGGTEDDHCSFLIQTADSRFAMAGYTESFGADNDDFYLVKTTRDPINAHRIPLRQGWNMLSSFNQPRIPDMPTVWSEVVSRGNLYMAKNQSGEFYNPNIGQNGFNNMAPCDVRQAYMAKLDWRDTLVIVNVPVSEDTPIPLGQGWNLISYFPERELDVRDALAGIADDVLLVKDINGRFYRPANNFSNMPPMTRGMGYQLGVGRATELVYPGGARCELRITNDELRME